MIERNPRTGWWEVRSDAEVRAVLGDPARFSSEPMGDLDRVLIGADPPEHAVVRRLVAASLRATAVTDERIAAIARELLAPMLAAGQGDAVRELARPLAAAATAAQLGIDQERAGDLLRFGDAVAEVADGKDADHAVFAELNIAVAQWAASRRSCPMGDGISIVVTGARGQAQLRPREVRSLVRLLVVAGIVTSARLSAGVLLATAGDPELQARLRAEPGQAPLAVEEALRRDPPLRFVLRKVAGEGVTVDGTALPAGALVACRLDHANRDAGAHPDPERFDVDRDASHVAFGAGAHRCPGAGLARRQAKVLLQTVLAATTELAPAGDVAWDRERHLQGPAIVPLRVVART
ncbi:MAG: cytochrome P450 [Solirubrobacteraceae bacterium]|nr:cytochrome P450 [Solirubrobacteraceae bacterium]